MRHLKCHLDGSQNDAVDDDERWTMNDGRSWHPAACKSSKTTYDLYTGECFPTTDHIETRFVGGRLIYIYAWATCTRTRVYTVYYFWEQHYIVLHCFYQGRSDGGYIGIYTPKSVYLNFLCGCFVSLAHDKLKLQWLVNIYTHLNQIPGYASANKVKKIKIKKQTVIGEIRDIDRKTKNEGNNDN